MDYDKFDIATKRYASEIEDIIHSEQPEYIVYTEKQNRRVKYVYSDNLAFAEQFFELVNVDSEEFITELKMIYARKIIPEVFKAVFVADNGENALNQVEDISTLDTLLKRMNGWVTRDLFIHFAFLSNGKVAITKSFLRGIPNEELTTVFCGANLKGNSFFLRSNSQVDYYSKSDEPKFGVKPVCEKAIIVANASIPMKLCEKINSILELENENLVFDQNMNPPGKLAKELSIHFENKYIVLEEISEQASTDHEEIVTTASEGMFLTRIIG